MSSSNMSYEEAMYHVHQFVDLGIVYCTHYTDEEIDELWEHWTFIVEYAHVNNYPDIFKKVVMYDFDLIDERIQQLQNQGASDEFIVEVGRTTPLHTLMRLSTNYFHGYGAFYSLPEVTKFLINAGAWVLSRNHCSESALDMLILEVPYMMREEKDNNGTIGNQEVLETLCILLAACVKCDWRRHNRRERIIDYLLDFDRIFRNYDNDDPTWMNLSYVNAAAENCRLISEILHRLVVHLAKHGPSEFSRDYEQSWLEHIMFCAAIAIDRQTRHVQCFAPLNSILDSLGDMFRYVLLHGVQNDLYTTCTARWLVTFFQPRATESDQPSVRSNKIIRHLLNGLSSTQIIELKKQLLVSQKSITEDTPNDLCAILSECWDSNKIMPLLKRGLDWLNSVQTPRSLQHLTRQTIIHTMSHRCMVGAATLEIPVHMIPYVLLEHD